MFTFWGAALPDHGVEAMRPVTGIDERRSDGDAWTERVRSTYEAQRTPLWRAVLVWSGSPDVADEAVSEAFAQLLRRGDGVRDPAAWVWSVAFKVAKGDLGRRRQRADRTAELAEVDDLAGQPERLSDEAIDLLRAVQGLSEQQRAVVALVDASGHSAVSAAEVLGTSAATVRVQLMRARRRLRTLLADVEPTPTGSTGVDARITRTNGRREWER